MIPMSTQITLCFYMIPIQVILLGEFIIPILGDAASDNFWSRFGSSVSIGGGTLLVGALYEDNSVSDNNDGRVYGFALEDIKIGENVESIEFDNGVSLSNGDKIFQPIYHARPNGS